MKIVGIALKEAYVKADTQDQNVKCKIKTTKALQMVSAFSDLYFFEYASLIEQVMENISSSKYFFLQNCSIVENTPAVMSVVSCFRTRYFLSGNTNITF